MALSSQALINLANNGSTHLKQTVESVKDESKPLIPYSEYINSPAWIGLRIQSSHIWGNNCLACGTNHHIDRHHLFYRERIEEGHPSEIIPLCRACHEVAHTDDENKNSRPHSLEGLRGIVNKLFHKIVRVRGLPTKRLNRSHKVFWKIFERYTKPLFTQGEVKVKNVKTTYKLRPGYDKQKKNKGRRGRRGKWKRFTPDEIVVKSNKRNKGCGFRVYPKFKTIKNYQAVVAANEFVPTYNLIKAEKPADTEAPAVWYNHPTGGPSNSLDSTTQDI